jgi:pimeloyl-ACP methyl ester carboxylesterase
MSNGGVTPLLLIHGGLWEADMDAERFWHRPGIVAGLRERDFTVLAPDRPPRPAGWAVEVDHLARARPDGPVRVLAGSNGCSVAVRAVIAWPGRVERLVLAWPATAGAAGVDDATRRHLAEAGAPPEVIAGLLAGSTLRGVTDDELAAVTMPVGLLPSVPENPAHQRRTVDALGALLPDPHELAGCPEPPRPDFPSHRDAFLDAVSAFLA